METCGCLNSYFYKVVFLAVVNVYLFILQLKEVHTVKMFKLYATFCFFFFVKQFYGIVYLRIFSL